MFPYLLSLRVLGASIVTEFQSEAVPLTVALVQYFTMLSILQMCSMLLATRTSYLNVFLLRCPTLRGNAMLVN